MVRKQFKKHFNLHSPWVTTINNLPGVSHRNSIEVLVDKFPLVLFYCREMLVSKYEGKVPEMHQNFKSSLNSQLNCLFYFLYFHFCLYSRKESTV